MTGGITLSCNAIVVIFGLYRLFRALKRAAKEESVIHRGTQKLGQLFKDATWRFLAQEPSNKVCAERLSSQIPFQCLS